MSPKVPCGPRPRRGAAAAGLLATSGVVTAPVSSGLGDGGDSEAAKAHGRRRPGRAPARSRGPLGIAAGAAIAAIVALATPAAASPATHAEVTRLGQTAPAWATPPHPTVILTARRPNTSVYRYTAGKGPTDRHGVLVHLLNPTPQGLTLVMAGFGSVRGYYLALLDVRPNNTFAWVKAADVTVSRSPYSIEVSLSRHRLLLWRGATVVRSFPVAVGKPSTATPTGYFFINAVVHNAGPDYGNIIMSTSGFSNAYTTFGPGDGDAAIGIHGTDEDALIGQSVSHGCIRMHTYDAVTLSHFVRPGVVVTVGK